MPNETAPRTPSRWALSSLLAKTRQEAASDVMLTGQTIDLTHAHTTVDRHGGTGPQTGTTEWSAKVLGRRFWLSWAWVEVMPDVLALADPMGIATNAKFHACDGGALVGSAIVLELNKIVYSLPWQPEVVAALVWKKKNKRPTAQQNRASNTERPRLRSRRAATAQHHTSLVRGGSVEPAMEAQPRCEGKAIA